MDIALSILIGALVGWIGYWHLGFNLQRGALVSTILGGLGGFIGGKVIAPMLTAGALSPGDFSAPALVCAAAMAAAVIAAASLVRTRWGV